MSIAIPDFVRFRGHSVKVNAQEDDWRKALEAQQARLIAKELERLGAIILPDDMTLRDVGQLRRRIRQLLPQLAGMLEWLLVRATELGLLVAVSELTTADVDRMQVDAAADNWRKQWNAELTPLLVANTERAAQQQLAKFHAGEQDINYATPGVGLLVQPPACGQHRYNGDNQGLRQGQRVGISGCRHSAVAISDGQ